MDRPLYSFPVDLFDMAKFVANKLQDKFPNVEFILKPFSVGEWDIQILEWESLDSQTLRDIKFYGSGLIDSCYDLVGNHQLYFKD